MLSAVTLIVEKGSNDRGLRYLSYTLNKFLTFSMKFNNKVLFVIFLSSLNVL
jgi:hypothetical protein